MKAHEETWEVRHDPVAAGQHRPCDVFLVGTSLPRAVLRAFGNARYRDGVSSDDRAKLAAAAPEMARLLLEVQWTPTGYDHEPCCPVCGLSQPKLGLTRSDEHFPHGHAKDCSFAAVLVKAGVLQRTDT